MSTRSQKRFSKFGFLRNFRLRVFRNDAVNAISVIGELLLKLLKITRKR